MKQRVLQFIRAHRRSAPLIFVARAAEKYLRAWHNEDFYAFDRNGERFVLAQFAKWWGERSLRVWDVGAHRGGWASEAHAALPQAHITSFEMIPQIYEQLTARLGSASWSTTVCSGLSDAEASVTAYWNQKYDTTSSLAPREGHALFDTNHVVATKCSVITGDAYAEIHCAPHFLKIDTEGHEISVLQGCKALLSGLEAPELIQFEYGSTFIPSGSTLKSAYDILVPVGYAIGRVYPNHIDFRPYTYADDNFRMGNFIAVKSPVLVKRLS